MIDINWLMQRACRLGVTFDRGKAIIPPTITIVKTNITNFKLIFDWCEENFGSNWVWS